MKTLFLGVDQGSHASRALLFDERGNEVASAYEDVNLNRLKDGCVEQNAVQLITSVKNVINKVLQSVKAGHIAGCGIATQRSSVLSWNTEGVARSPVLSWQDVRGSELVTALQPHGANIQNISGLPLSAHYGASKMRWLLDNIPAGGDTSNHIHLSPLVSYLLYHLLDTKPCLVDHSNAQRTQLMDINTLDWSARLTQWFGVPEQLLPECIPIVADYGVLAASGIPVTAVCGDQNAALSGAGRLSENTALVNLGSGAFVLRTLSENRPSKNQLSSVAYSDDKTVQYVREATINGAGSALAWLGNKYHIDRIQERLPEWLKTVDKPLLFINTIGGLGSPWWRQDIEADFIGEDQGNEGALVIAVVESIIFMVRANLDLMMSESPLTKLRVSGGLARLDGLCQKLANLCALPVERGDITEATARGVAWLAAGRPAHWMRSEFMENFIPVVDEKLSQRYLQYMAALNLKLRVGV